MRVAAYCRVSTETEEQRNSLRNQREYFERYILEHPQWSLEKIYYDEGITGTQILKRKGFQKMLEAAEKGKIDLLLTKEVSRFARNTIDTLYYTRRLKEMGVGVIFISDGIDTRAADGELRLTMMAGIAQEESRKISERVRWGQQRSMEKGVVFGRNLLGYQVKEGRLFPVEEEALLVKQIFYRYTVEGKSSTQIAREFNEEGKESKRKAGWSSGTILKILKNEKYVGDLCQKKTITLDHITHRKKKNQGEEEKIYLKDHHRGLIDRALWERTQEELARKSTAKGERRKYSRRYWCSGKMICAECGNTYVRYTKKYKNGGQYIGWRCYGKVKGYGKLEDTKCKNPSFSERALREVIREEIKKQLPKERECVERALFQRVDVIYGRTEHKSVRKEKAREFSKEILKELYDGIPADGTELVYGALLKKMVVSSDGCLVEWEQFIEHLY